MVKRLMDLIGQLKTRSIRHSPSAVWDEESLLRPQFQRAVRIEKIVPLPSTEHSESYFGGKPQLPDGIEWPSIEKEPMVFLAQINCTEIPEHVWGGVGPRTGWLLFFLQYTSLDGPLNIQCKVIHVEGLGTERTVDVPDEYWDNFAWCWYWMRTSLRYTATPFPKWPVRLIEVVEAEDGPASIEGKNPSLPHEPDWSVREKMYPVKWELLEELRTLVSMMFDSECRKCRGLWKRLYSDVKTYKSKSLGGLSHRDRLHYEACLKALEELREHAGKLALERKRFTNAAPSLKVSGTTTLVDQSTWDNFIDALSEFSITKTSWTTVRPERLPVIREKYNFGTTFEKRPETYGDYFNELTRIIVTNSRIVKPDRPEPPLQRKLVRAREIANETHDTTKLDPDMLDHYLKQKQVQKENVAELEKAQTFVPESLNRALKLRDIKGRHERYNDKITDDEWAAILPELQGLITATKEREVVVDQIASVETLQFKTGPLLDYSDGRFRDWKNRQRAELLQQYSMDPLSLPEAARGYQEYKCLEYAASMHDGMGGIPRWDWVYYDYFEHYRSDRPVGQEDFETGRTASADPPFDVDNAVLLQLFSSDLPGWLFGDASHVVFIIPRDHLARGDFSTIDVITHG